MRCSHRERWVQGAAHARLVVQARAQAAKKKISRPQPGSIKNGLGKLAIMHQPSALKEQFNVMCTWLVRIFLSGMSLHKQKLHYLQASQKCFLLMPGCVWQQIINKNIYQDCFTSMTASVDLSLEPTRDTLPNGLEGKGTNELLSLLHEDVS